MKLFVFIVLLKCFIGLTETQITAWTAPGALTGASGHIEIAASKAENSVAADAELFTVAATASGGSVTYALVSSTDSVAALATNKVNVATGKVLNYETASKYIFVVTATEGGSTGTATITLTVTDVNDVAFSPDTYKACILDNSAAGTTLTTVTAAHQDGTTALSGYSLTAGNTNTDFEVTSAGVIKVAAGKTINKATTATYTLTVEATDGTTKDSAEVTVTVATDCSAASALSVAIITMALALMSHILN